MINWKIEGIETAPRDGTRVLLWLIPSCIWMPFAWQNNQWMGDDYPLNMAEPTHWVFFPPDGPKVAP